MALPKIPKLKPFAEASQDNKNIIKVVFGGVLLMLLAAFGLESTNNDWNLNKLLSGSSMEESKIKRDADGNFLLESCEGNVYNCTNFDYREDAQEVLEKCGGVGYDINKLDGDKDGTACESLPSKE